MDADRFDALSKRVATPTTRRATLGALIASAFGLAGAAPVVRAAQGQTCTMAFVAAIRLGPSQSQALTPDGNQPGQLQGELSFSLANDGNLEQAALKLSNGTTLPVVGQATGNSLQLRITLDGRQALVALGVGEDDIADVLGGGRWDDRGTAGGRSWGLARQSAGVDRSTRGDGWRTKAGWGR